MNQLYTGDALKEAPYAFQGNETHDAFELPTFIPDPQLVKAIQMSLKLGWPLLVTGEKFRRDMVAKAIAFELFGAEFPDNIMKWSLMKKESFRKGVYTYDHSAKKRDLEYHQLDPKNNPLKPADFYLNTGAVLATIQQYEKSDSWPPPVLEICHLQEADENFIADMMDFLLMERAIYIPETDYRLARKLYRFPIIILTAEPGYQLPNNYDGVIYAYEMPFPRQDEFLKELLGYYGYYLIPPKPDADGNTDFSKAVRLKDRSDFPQLQTMIGKLVDLFYLIKDSRLLRKGDGQLPMTVLELKDAIALKIREVTIEGQSIEAFTNSIEALLESQRQLAASFDLGDSVEIIRDAITQGKMNDATKSLELIQGKFSNDLKNEALQLISRHNELSNIEMMGIESPLILYPQKNKLSFDLLQFLDKVS